MKRYFESQNGDIIRFSAVQATAQQLGGKRIVHLKGGEFILLFGDAQHQFVEEFREYLQSLEAPMEGSCLEDEAC